MKAAVKRFLTFDARNVVPEVYWALVIVYVTLVVVTLLSIRGAAIDARSKSAWTLIVLVVPVLGMMAYCIFSLLRADYSFLRSLGMFRRKNTVDSR